MSMVKPLFVASIASLTLIITSITSTVQLLDALSAMSRGCCYWPCGALKPHQQSPQRKLAERREVERSLLLLSSTPLSFCPMDSVSLTVKTTDAPSVNHHISRHPSPKRSW